MKVLVAGSREWSDYNEVMRKMTVIIDRWVSTNPEEKKITFIHTGNDGAENMVTEYIGKVEKFMRQKGYTITESLVRVNTTQNSSNVVRDFDIIASGADLAVIFMKGKCKRTQSFSQMSASHGIPTEIVKG